MNLIEAGKICRNAGFNWGKGSWWGVARYTEDFYEKCWVQTEDIPFESIGLYLPLLTKGATRGVILQWAREKTGYEDLSVHPCYSQGLRVPKNAWCVTSLIAGTLDFTTDTEIECYAKLCQWVRDNRK